MSICRAGKNINITRYLGVQKQERAHKPVTGRAKKRLLYNRRIKNAAALNGGPNFQGEVHRKPTVDGAVMNQTFVPKKRLQYASSNYVDQSRMEDTIAYSRRTSFGLRKDRDMRSHHRKMKGVDAEDIRTERVHKIALRTETLYIVDQED